MEFDKVTTAVKKKLSEMSLIDKVLLFKQLFNFPIDYKDGVFEYGSHEWDENRMKNFMEINMHWMTVREFDKMYYHFEKNNLL
jgi:hypothetical protein